MRRRRPDPEEHRPGRAGRISREIPGVSLWRWPRAGYEIALINHTQTDDQTSAASFRALAGAIALVGLGGVALAATVATRASDWEVVATALAALAWLLSGWLVAVRQPRLPFGWLLLAAGLFLSTGGAMIAYGSAGVTDSWPAAVWMAWAGTWSFFPHLGCMEAAYLLFPTGRLPSPRWRPVVAAIVVVNVTMAISAAFAPGAIGFTETLDRVSTPAEP